MTTAGPSFSSPSPLREGAPRHRLRERTLPGPVQVRPAPPVQVGTGEPEVAAREEATRAALTSTPTVAAIPGAGSVAMPAGGVPGMPVANNVAGMKIAVCVTVEVFQSKA